jgi:C-terminal processing protease CtpA/Prc
MVLNRSDDKNVYFYEKPVVVLMDPDCFSATDIFLAGLKGWRNVTLIGTASGGGSARSVSFNMPDSGIKIKIASMASFQPNGKLYDSNGVQPDEVVQPSAGYFIGREDPVLERAIEIIGL